MKRWKCLFLPAIFLSVLFLCLFASCHLPFFGPGAADYDYRLAGDYELQRSATRYIYILRMPSRPSGSKMVVPETVTGIAWDSDFILASRENRESSGASESPDYWVIDVKSEKVYGPLSESEFAEKRKTLRVSEKLKLKDPDTYKSLDSSVRSN